MIIAKKAREAFIARQRLDYRKYKDLTNQELEQRMLRLPVKPPIWYKLTRPQRVSFIIGAENQRFCYWLDTGTGKTLLAIALIRYFRRLGILKRALILVPAKLNKHEWVLELRKHSPTSSYLVLDGTSVEKWKQLEQSNALFVFETYAGLVRMACEAKDNAKYIKPVKARVRQLAKIFGGLVCDESVNVGHHTSLIFRVCRKMSKTCQAVFTMTGTPFNRDPTLIWAQMFLVDAGYTLGETLGLFRSVFCTEKENYFSGEKEYKFNGRQQDLLNEFIANASISYPADEAELPECVEIQKYVGLPDDASAYSEAIYRQIVAAKGNIKQMENAFMRMRQISSGFLGYEDDETGEKAKYIFPDNPKLDLLLSILATIHGQYKSIVFFDFNLSGERILKELKARKINAVLVYGKTKDVVTAKDSFVNDDKVRVMLLQNKMAAGLNAQVAKYGIFYESPVSAIDRKQARRRVERQHSAHDTVFIYDLVTENTVDERILSFHKEGGDLFESIIRGR